MDFEQAQQVVKDNHSKFNNDELLDFYKLYKQATVGDINTDRPGMFSLKERAKWDAWNSVSGMEKSEAENLYIETVEKIMS